jgi:hypothetical protein
MPDGDRASMYKRTTSFEYVPGLSARFVPVYVNNYLADFDIVNHHDRVTVARHLRFYRNRIRHATEFCIYVNDDGNDTHRGSDAALRFALGGRSVDWSTPSAGTARRGNVHVVFDSLRGSLHQVPGNPYGYPHEIAASSDEWRLNNTEVAKKMAAAINNILISHGPNQRARITACEFKKLICVLDDIHGIKLDGFGKSLRSRHIDAGAAADFWAMVERQ